LKKPNINWSYFYYRELLLKLLPLLLFCCVRNKSHTRATTTFQLRFSTVAHDLPPSDLLLLRFQIWNLSPITGFILLTSNPNSFISFLRLPISNFHSGFEIHRDFTLFPRSRFPISDSFTLLPKKHCRKISSFFW
jgi:hypothetical protein